MLKIYIYIKKEAYGVKWSSSYIKIIKHVCKSTYMQLPNVIKTNVRRKKKKKRSVRWFWNTALFFVDLPKRNNKHWRVSDTLKQNDPVCKPLYIYHLRRVTPFGFITPICTEMHIVCNDDQILWLYLKLLKHKYAIFSKMSDSWRLNKRYQIRNKQHQIRNNMILLSRHVAIYGE